MPRRRIQHWSINGVKYKFCPTCELWKDIKKSFGKSKRNWDKIYYECKICSNNRCSKNRKVVIKNSIKYLPFHKKYVDIKYSFIQKNIITREDYPICQCCKQYMEEEFFYMGKVICGYCFSLTYDSEDG